jgi:hypothetical protein
MAAWLMLLVRFAAAAFKGRGQLLLENLTVRHLLLVLRLTTSHPACGPQIVPVESAFPDVGAHGRPAC